MALEQIPRLNSLKIEIHKNWVDYAQAGGTLAATAGIVYAMWGKRASAAFVIAAIPAFPYLKKPICTLYHYDTKAVALAGIAMSAAALCFLSPYIASFTMVGVAITILRRDWISAQNAAANQQEIDVLRHANQTLKCEGEKVKAQITELQTCFNKTLEIAKKVQQVVGSSQEIDVSTKNLGKQLDEKLIQIRTNVEGLTAIFNSVIASEGLMDRLETSKHVEDQLSEITAEYRAREMELKLINDQLRPAREELDRVTKALWVREKLEQGRLLDFMTLMSGIKNPG